MAAGVWKQDTLEGLDKGSRVWYKASANEWRLGTLQSSAEKAECSLALDSERGEGCGQVITVQTSLLVPANPKILDGVNDLTTLSYLNEASILHDLRQRYGADDIYTHAGPVLIAINPFKRVPLYAPEIIQHYKARQGSQQADGYEPHVFLTADKAYKAMCTNSKSQSLVISGESGAGKTETTKIAMQYLAGLAGGTGVEGQVLSTNPLLEAFGNAKTLRNNNSSRFGKLIDIYFNNSRHICGALIQTYLLEKSRVVHQLPGERNYHIFYQICRGLNAEERQQLRIPADTLEAFRYLRTSGCTSIDGVDDGADLADVKKAMTAVGIAPAKQANIFQLLAAILWLGNIEFDVKTDDSVTVRRDAPLANAAALLQCSEDALASALSTRKITAGGETISMDLKLESAIDTRDALAKAAYAALFRWLVEQINVALAVGKRKSDTSLSILDIYGFECFKENSFEQLCINYANERLQQQFNKHLFKLEQEAYATEGIDWAHVEFEDNQECVDLIENRPPKSVGIISLLDEECMFPKATDSTFSAKLRENLTSNKRFSYNPKVPTDDFAVEHYAGEVVYSCHKFLDKNKDSLSPDLVELMETSGEPLLQHLAAEIAKTQEKRGSQTVGSRFRDQLKDLIQRLDQTELHFVRCIKPNGAQVADRFDAPLILHQLRCCGVLEVTRIARAGYPTRYLHTHFADRYLVLLSAASQRKLARAPALDVCKRVLEEYRIDRSMFQIGHTKLFFRAGVLGQLEDTWARIQRSVLTIQSTYRMLRCRRVFRHQRACASRIQARQRGRQARALKARADVTRIQMAWRRRQVGKRVAVRMAARQKEEAVQSVIREARRHEEEQFESIKAHFGVNNRAIRDILELWQLHVEQPVSPDVERPAVLSASAYQQIAMWEEYAVKLEEQMKLLLQDNELLQKGLISVHKTIGSEDLQGMLEWSGRQSGSPGAPAGTISAHSDEYFDPDSATLSADVLDSPGAQVPILASGQREAVASGRKYVEKLQEEFERKQALFQDDAAFIQEVKEGRSHAEGMNPDVELRNLKLRFDAFRKDFKARLMDTGDILKKIEKEERKAASAERRLSGDKDSLARRSLTGQRKATLPRNLSASSASSHVSAISANSSELTARQPSLGKRSVGKLLSKLSFTKSRPVGFPGRPAPA
ncbi:hypothetical protein WJX72_004563 [[Myrmecia] bisecta]|uniref:Uncharacterized protein n=1 Tax=[Myrmecia] bisecta TaxID=41462 RepID=A0AAW1P9K8_9CHLO